MAAPVRVQRRAVLPALALVAIAGCGTTAKDLGSKAAEGALDTFQRKRAEQPESEKGAIAEHTGYGAGRGAVEEITRPENVDRLSEAFARGAASALERLAAPRVPEGGGGSGSPMAALTGEMGTGASRAMLDELSARIAASCPAADPAACLDLRAQALGRSVSAGMVQELGSRLRWPLMAAVFAAGVLLGAAVRQMARLAGVTFRRARGRR